MASTPTEGTARSTHLVWNQSGQVNCAEHAPYRGSDTWKNERWSRVPACDETAHVTCETCDYIARKAVAR